MLIVQVYVFIWYNIICFEIIISVHRSTRWSLFGIRINEWMNEFFSIDCSENDDCEGKTLVTTPNPKLLLFLMFLTYDWCTFIFVLKRNPPIIFKIRLLGCMFPMKNVNFTIKQLTEQVTTQRFVKVSAYGSFFVLICLVQINYQGKNYAKRILCVLFTLYQSHKTLIQI